MKIKYRLILVIFVLFIGSACVFAQVNKTEQQRKIDQLIQTFWNLSYGQTGNMSEAFREIGDPLIEPLMKMLRKEESGEGAWRRIEWNQRRVAWILGELGSEKAIEHLIEILQDKTLNIFGRHEAARALGRIKSEKAVDPLIEVLNDKELDPPVRYGAAYALGDMQSEKAVPSLTKALSENNVQIRMGVVTALGNIGSDKAVDALMKALEDMDGYIRRLAYSNLRRLKPEKEVEFLIMALKDEDWGAREDAVEALVEIGEPVSELLINSLKDKDSAARWEAARVLGKIKSEKAAGALIEALKDNDWMVRNEAAVALTRLNSEKTVEPLIGMLKDKNGSVREEAAWILGEMKSEEAIEPLIQVLNDKECGWMAAMALGNISSEKAVEPLINIIKNENNKVRRAAARALGEIKNEKAVKPLIEALKDEDREVRLLAVDALEKIGTPEALKAVEEYKKQISYNQKTFNLYPETLDMLPDIPSPFTTEDGKEIVVGFTKNEKFALVLVTVENGTTYFYNGNFGKGKQIDVDAKDFPTLAETGLHSEIELDQTRTITDKSISEITYLGRPERSSGAGFMGNDENIISVLKGDNRLVEKMGLTHPQMAKPLFHVWNLILKDYELGNISGQYGGNIKYILYNGKKILLEAHGTRGFQESIFDDEIRGNFQMNILRELDGHEKEFLNKKYSNLNEEQMEELVKKLSYFHTGEMVPYYVMRYGFYEGHTDYRADPIVIAFIFGLKSLEEIESIFNGNLYEVLTTHFTKENIGK